MQWYMKAMRQYADFKGRARRSEYWWFTLVNLAIAVVLALLDQLLDSGVLGGLYSLFVLIPSLAVGVRRLHDTDRSGWWLLISLVPIIGAIVLLVFFVQDSEPGSNRFGPSPKQSLAGGETTPGLA